ncbi:hypothetical protein VB264_05140 [Arcicella aquatica]|uniref:Uncharacterized protein n=1 Tax=Arcicella aquatica TaxID=217141 RepID=A0ABU5QJB1_9BACT|nr:hypothetical protein [Arcicella aquatica]MEA5257161.1 hypothetical protein [Arcicella aquatica]
MKLKKRWITRIWRIFVTKIVSVAFSISTFLKSPIGLKMFDLLLLLTTFYVKNYHDLFSNY